eukprot:scaffold106732_cov34-Tisochrysis_lutea.AAC.2
MGQRVGYRGGTAVLVVGGDPRPVNACTSAAIVFSCRALHDVSHPATLATASTQPGMAHKHKHEHTTTSPIDFLHVLTAGCWRRITSQLARN